MALDEGMTRVQDSGELAAEKQAVEETEAAKFAEKVAAEKASTVKAAADKATSEKAAEEAKLKAKADAEASEEIYAALPAQSNTVFIPGPNASSTKDRRFPKDGSTKDTPLLTSVDTTLAGLNDGSKAKESTVKVGREIECSEDSMADKVAAVKDATGLTTGLIPPVPDEVHVGFQEQTAHTQPYVQTGKRTAEILRGGQP